MFETPDPFPISGVFLVYANTSKIMKDLTIFQVGADYVKWYDGCISTYDNEGKLHIEWFDDCLGLLTKIVSSIVIVIVIVIRIVLPHLKLIITKDYLIDVKNMWATFGQLTEKEMTILQKAASTLNAAADRDEDGNIYFFTMWEEDFKKELKTTLDKLKTTRTSLLWENKDTLWLWVGEFKDTLWVLD